jgi:hypothetical protein
MLQKKPPALYTELQNIDFLYFFLFSVGHFCHPKSGSGSIDLIESGSETPDISTLQAFSGTSRSIGHSQMVLLSTYLSRRVEDMFSSLSLASRKSGSLARARLKAFSASSILFYRINHDTVHFTFKVYAW